MEHQIYVYIHNKLISDIQLNHLHINLMQMDIHYDDEIQIEIFLKQNIFFFNFIFKLIIQLKQTIWFNKIFKNN
jgi:hypothetical protein